MANIGRLCLVFLVVCSSYNVASRFIDSDDTSNDNNVAHFKKYIKNYEFCDICKEVVELVTHALESNKTFEDIRPDAIKVCFIVMKIKKISGPAVCSGLIDSYGPPVIFIISQREFDPAEVCQRLNFCPPKAAFEPLKPSSIVQQRTEPRCEPPSLTQSAAPPIRVLHISDIHMDSLYAEGSPSHCDVFMCCRTDYNGTGSAGPYGDYRCDIPLKTLNVLLSAIKELDPQPDFFLYTGDSPPHDVWEESWKSQMAADFNMIKHLSAEFPNIYIYPAFGNHETYPTSLYYQPGDAYQAFTVKTADWWRSLFNLTLEEMNTVRYAAYYSHLITPGLRILSINTDFGYTINFYTLINDQIKAYKDQLAFMDTTLMAARKNNEKVIIIGHVPPGDEKSVTLEYGDVYTDLVTRYSDVIVMQAFGHTHHDQFEVVTDPHKNVSTPTGVIFIAPSATTFSNVNPSFREYLLDRMTFEVLDYNQYFLNLTEANESGKPTVRLSYSLKKEYGLTDASPASMEKLTDRFLQDPALFQKYNDNYYARSGHDRNCDTECQKSHYCGCRSASLRAILKCLQ